MTVKNPKIMVVDASIAGASGSENALHPIPILCRDFLEEIYTLDHKIIMTRDIRKEWIDHQTNPARMWFQKMASRGQIITYRNDISDNDLRMSIFAVVDPNAVEAVEKDMRLIEAALLSDNIVSSLERKIRGHFHRAAAHVEVLKTIIWINPTIEDENCIEWLRQSCTPDDHRKLGYTDPTN